MDKRIFGMGAAGALVAGLLGAGVVGTASADEERLPAAEFRPCTTATQFYCIESVTFAIDGLDPQQGIWVPAGQDIPALPAPEPDPVEDDTDATDDDSVTVSAANLAILPTGNLPGRWSFPGFPSDFVGYDGVLVQVGPASPASDVAWIRLTPAGLRADGTVGRAVSFPGSTTPADLDQAMRTTVVMRFGPLEPTANIQVADGRISAKVEDSNNIVTFSGYPVLVARQASTADCLGEDGVAMDRVYQQYAFIVFGNTRQSFGYDGMSGRLSIATNGTCRISTPTYDEATGEFSFVASAPHFAPDGIEVNRGFYIASIPLQDAALLFGITKAKQVRAALELSVENEQGIEIPVQYSVAVRRGVISVAAAGFQYSQPTFTLSVKDRLWDKKFKKKAKKAQKKAEAKSSR